MHHPRKPIQRLHLFGSDRRRRAEPRNKRHGSRVSRDGLQNSPPSDLVVVEIVLSRDEVRHALARMNAGRDEADGARAALVALFQAEMAKGPAANAELLTVIGRFLDAATLMGK